MELSKDNIYRFEEYELDADRRSLTYCGEPITLYPKTFDLLLELVRNPGQTISKDELLERVWPDQIVEENNLTVQISALRKIFGDTNSPKRYISTIPGKGYRFVAEVLNPPFENEFLVEQRTTSRIIVESEESWLEESSDQPNIQGRLLPPTRTSADGWKGFGRSALVLAAVGLFLFIGLAFVYRGPFSRDQATAVPFQQNTVRQLTTNGKVGSAALSLDGRMFAYTTNDLGNHSLWLGYVNGESGDLQLMRGDGNNSLRDLVFARDGLAIYYSASDPKNQNSAIFRIPISGGVPAKLVEGVQDFSLSPDGTQVIFLGTEGSDGQKVFYSIDTTTLELRDLGRLDPGFTPTPPSMSPDGGRLAFGLAKANSKKFDTVGILDLKTGQLQEIGTTSARELTRTTWMADGNSLVVTALANGSYASIPQYRLWNVDLATGKFTMLTSDLSNYGESWLNDSGISFNLSQANDLLLGVEHRQATNIWVAPADDLASAKQRTFGSFGKYDGLWGLDWAADGKVIYTTTDTQNQYIAEMTQDGSVQRPLTDPNKVDSQLTVSADSKYVFFHSNRTSELDIWQINIDGSGRKQLTFGGFGYHPAPSADGKWVYYKSYHRGRGELWKVPIDGGEPQLVNENEPYYPVFSPDGKHFACGLRTDKVRLAIFSAETDQIVNQFDLPETATTRIGLRWTPDSNAVAFRDKERGYWVQPMDGSQANRIQGLPDETLYNFAWSKDGSKFAFVRGQEIRDVVIFQDQTR